MARCGLPKGTRVRRVTRVRDTTGYPLCVSHRISFEGKKLGCTPSLYPPQPQSNNLQQTNFITCISSLILQLCTGVGPVKYCNRLKKGVVVRTLLLSFRAPRVLCSKKKAEISCKGRMWMHWWRQTDDLCRLLERGGFLSPPSPLCSHKHPNIIYFIYFMHMSLTIVKEPKLLFKIQWELSFNDDLM